jgi:FkbM family methyltransferase
VRDDRRDVDLSIDGYEVRGPDRRSRHLGARPLRVAFVELDHREALRVDALKALAPLAEASGPLHLVDVGARGRTVDERWAPVAEHVRAFAFESDEAGAAEAPGTEQQILAGGPGRRTFRHRRQPTVSSLHDPETALTDRYRVFHYPGDGALRGAFEVLETEEVETLSLDAWQERRGIDRIDVLKVDVEGAELEVLRGASRALRTALGVLVEVDFARRWRAENGLPATLALLEEASLFPFDLQDPIRVGRRRAPFFAARLTNGGYRSAGQLLGGNLLFLADPLSPHSRRTFGAAEIGRLAVVAAAYDQVELAAELLDVLRQGGSEVADRCYRALAALAE